MGHVTSREASNILGYTGSAVADMCRRGRLKAQKVNRHWQIDSDSLSEYMEYRKTSNYLNALNYDARLEQAKTAHKVQISRGNTKLGNIPQFNLLPLETCAGSTPLCREDCYMVAELRCFLNSRLAYTVNTWMVLNHLSEVETALTGYIAEKAPPLFRIHSSGDFMGRTWTTEQGRSYVDMWHRIARTFPGTKFMAFTKVFTLDHSDKPGNFTLIYSVFPDTIYTDIPQDGNKLAFCVYPKEQTDRQYTPEIAGQVYDQKQSIPCAGSCKECAMCWYIDGVKKNVVFHIH